MTAYQDSRKEKAPHQRGSFCATTTKNTIDFVTNRDTENCSSTWQARYAICGHTLYRTTSPGGEILYLASRWGLVREMKSLEAVAAFFAMIGGAR